MVVLCIQREKNLCYHPGHGGAYGDTTLPLGGVFVHQCKSEAGSSPVGTTVAL